MRRTLIAGAWKLYLPLEESIAHAKKLGDFTAQNPLDFDVVVAPSLINLAHVAKVLEGAKIAVGAQNVHQETLGAFTGQVAISELSSIGVKFIILGHSELRLQQGESDNQINDKIRLCLSNSIHPIACVGESREDREAGKSEELIKRQVMGMLAGVDKADGFDVENIVIAYEPVWAIKGGRDDTGTTPATPEIANQMQEYIRSLLNEKYGQDVGEKIRILYGGSAGPDNAQQLLEQPSIDGLLVGSKSVVYDSFVQILLAAQNVVKQAGVREHVS